MVQNAEIFLRLEKKLKKQIEAKAKKDKISINLTAKTILQDYFDNQK